MSGGVKELVAWHRQHNRIPDRVPKGQSQKTSSPERLLEHDLCRVLDHLLALVKGGSSTPALEYVQAEAPQLLKPTSIAKAERYVALWQQRGGLPAGLPLDKSDEEGKKAFHFLKRKRMEYPDKGDAQVYAILSAAFPNWAITRKRKQLPETDQRAGPTASPMVVAGTLEPASLVDSVINGRSKAMKVQESQTNPQQAGCDQATAPPQAFSAYSHAARRGGVMSGFNSALHGVAGACANELPGASRTRNKSQAAPAGPSTAPTSEALTLSTWAEQRFESEEQRMAVREHHNKISLHDPYEGIVFVPALVVLLHKKDEGRGGGAAEGKQGDGKGKSKAKRGDAEEDAQETTKETASIIGMKCYIRERVVGGPELDLSGIRMEQSWSTREHYQVALSYFKATWHVYTQQLQIHARPNLYKVGQPVHDPFKPGQCIQICVGDGRVQTTGTSATAAAFLSLFARFTQCQFRPDCAVTAELSLSGLLLSVGSVPTKLRGAKEYGIKRVVVSKETYADLPDTWKEDPDMEVRQARTAYELIGLCRNEEQGKLPVGGANKALAPFFTAQSWHDGDTLSLVEATAYPGSGRLIITGLKPNDLQEGKMPTWNDRGCTNTALKWAISWLESRESCDWFRFLPRGPQRLDLKRRVLISDEAVAGGQGTVEVERLADVHIHFPQDPGSCRTGLAIVVALAQLMRGKKTKLKAWYRGCVEADGAIFPAPSGDKEVTRQDFDVIIVPEWPRDEEYGYPKAMPAGKRVEGFTNAVNVIKHIYLPGNMH